MLLYVPFPYDIVSIRTVNLPYVEAVSILRISSVAMFVVSYRKRRGRKLCVAAAKGRLIMSGDGTIAAVERVAV